MKYLFLLIFSYMLWSSFLTLGIVGLVLKNSSICYIGLGIGSCSCILYTWGLIKDFTLLRDIMICCIKREKEKK